eukprot:8885668-Karenia_brevis.AAC.1
MVRFTCAVIGAWKLPVVLDQRLVSGTNVGMPSRPGGDTLVPYSLNFRLRKPGKGCSRYLGCNPGFPER